MPVTDGEASSGEPRRRACGGRGVRSRSASGISERHVSEGRASESRPSHRWPTERVVGAAQRGDPWALATLVTDSHAHVQRFAHMLCASSEDAEEAAQEALIVLYRRIGTLRATAALASWVFQIVRSECMRRTRVALRSAHTVQGQVEQPSAEDVVLRRLEVDRIVEAIAALPAEQRAVLVLRDLHGLSGGATAQKLGLSRAAMKSRLHRGRVTLRTNLRP